MLAIKLILVLSFSIFLGKITDKLIKNLESLSRIFGIGHFEMTAIVLALATTLPEMVVSISSSIKGLPQLAFGNAIGSNIANLSLILGLVAIAGRSLHFFHKGELKEIFYPLSYTFVPLLLGLDGEISRFDGVVLLIFYGYYVISLIKKDRRTEDAKLTSSGGRVSMVLLKTAGLTALMIAAAQIIVLLAKQFAAEINLPLIFVGLFIVSVGTSLPELFFNIQAAGQRKVEMSLGSIIGSCVANATLITGLSALIHPIGFENMYHIWLPGLEYLAISVLMVVMAISKHRLDWWEGLILTGLFLFYTTLELIIK